MSKTSTYSVTVTPVPTDFTTTTRVVRQDWPFTAGTIEVIPSPATEGTQLYIKIPVSNYAGLGVSAKVGLQTVGLTTGNKGDVIWTPAVHIPGMRAFTFEHWHPQWSEDCVDEIQIIMV